MILRGFLLFLALAGFTSQLYCQQITTDNYSAIILDLDTQKPVIDAHVIVANSTVSTHSDPSGIFSIAGSVAAGQDIIISHVGYNLMDYTLPIEISGLDSIWIEPKSEVVNVTIKTEKTDIKKKRLKIFEKDLFGTWQNSKKMTLLNPEAVLFEERGDSLIAYATDFIKIRNEFLGYNVLFYLKEYLHTDELTRYNGKAFFEELDAKKNKSKKFVKRRRSYKENGRAAFFKSILQNQIENSNFKTTYNDKNLSEHLASQHLLYKTTMKGVYGILANGIFKIEFDHKDNTLFPKNGLILFNDEGQVLNERELSASGVWNKRTLTELLPIDFEETITQIDETLFSNKVYSIAELRKMGNELHKANNQDPLIQELKLNTDRLLYQTTEEISISALVLNHRTQTPMTESEIIHFELLNEQKEIIKRKTRQLNKGISQVKMSIPDTTVRGQYYVRAFTDYMLNFDHGLIPHKPIGIGMIHYPVIPETNINDSIQISLYPDGGRLMSGESSRIVFRATDPIGNPVEYVGKIKEIKTGQVFDLKTISDGWGLFYIRTSQPTEFYIEDDTKFNISITNNKLSEFSDVAILVSSHHEDYFSISFIGLDSISDSKLMLKFKGQDLHSILNCKSGTAYKLSKDFLPHGHIALELFDQSDNLLASRWVNNGIEDLDYKYTISKNYSFFYPRQKANFTLKIDSTDALNFKDLNWQSKVVHSEYDPDLRKKINSKRFKSNTERRILDLSLNSYTLNQLIASAYQIDAQDLKIRQRNSLSLKGQAIDADTKEGKKSKVNISSLSSEFYFDEVSTEENGFFEFDSIPFLKNVSFLVQARSIDSEGEAFEEGNRDVNIVFIEKGGLVDENKIILNKIEGLIDQDSIIELAGDTLAQNQFALSQEIEEIVVKSKKINTYDRYGVHNLAEMDWIRKDARPRNILSTLYPRTTFRNDPDNPQSYLAMSRGKWLPVFLIVNGDLQFTPARFENLIADQIMFIGLFRTPEAVNVVIQTNPGFLSREEIKLKSIGVKDYTFQETIETEDFKDFNPNTDLLSKDSKDLRKTIDWDPYFQLDKTGKGTLDFFTSDVTGTYKIEFSTMHPVYGEIVIKDYFEVAGKE